MNNHHLSSRTVRKEKPQQNANCIPPICGEPPNYCPEQELVSACRQQITTIETTLLRRTTLALNMNDDDDTTEKSSSSSNSAYDQIDFICRIKAICLF